MYYPHEKQKIHSNQILTILLLFRTSMPNTNKTALLHKTHLFRTRQNNNKKARKLGQIKTLLF